MNIRSSFLFLSIILILISCDNNQGQLFYINDYNDLVYMAESTNVKTLDRQTSIYLTPEEKRKDYYTYKNFGEIYRNEFYKAFVIFSKMTEPKLHYSFKIRTYNKKNNAIIDSFIFSGYSHDSGEFYSGSINNKLVIETHSDAYSYITRKKINNFGKIIDIN